jgi:HAD superfamily hydrolase (TIGR01662 family)
MDALEQYMNEMYGQPEDTTVNSKFKLIIFDLDGTLAPFDSDQLYPDAAAWLETNQEAVLNKQIIVATNQGGIGLRHWMSVGGFGEPDKYPTLEDFEGRIGRMFPALKPTILMCARYQSKKTGAWSPLPPGVLPGAMWHPEWRKPEPGMLFHAMGLCGTAPEETLMVGDGDEDKQAAENAGCAFQWAWEFFGRPKPENGGE